MITNQILKKIAINAMAILSLYCWNIQGPWRSDLFQGESYSSGVREPAEHILAALLHPKQSPKMTLQ